MARRTAVSELLSQFLGVFLRIFFKCCNPNCVESVDAAYGCADRVVRWAFFVILLVVKPRNPPNHQCGSVRHLRPDDRISMGPGSPAAPRQPIARWYGRQLLGSSGMLNRFRRRTNYVSPKVTLCGSTRK